MPANTRRGTDRGRGNKKRPATAKSAASPAASGSTEEPREEEPTVKLMNADAKGSEPSSPRSPTQHPASKESATASAAANPVAVTDSTDEANQEGFK